MSPIRLLACPGTSIHTAMLSSSTEASFFQSESGDPARNLLRRYFEPWIYPNIHYFLYFS
jgi:hypothetical protein